MSDTTTKSDLATTLDAILAEAVNSGQVPGVVAAAADAHGVIYEGGFGVRTLGQDAPMTADTVVWIASMTKAVTAAANEHLHDDCAYSFDTWWGLWTYDKDWKLAMQSSIDCRVVSGNACATAASLAPAEAQFIIRKRDDRG